MSCNAVLSFEKLKRLVMIQGGFTMKLSIGAGGLGVALLAAMFAAAAATAQGMRARLPRTLTGSQGYSPEPTGGPTPLA